MRSEEPFCMYSFCECFEENLNVYFLKTCYREKLLYFQGAMSYKGIVDFTEEREVDNKLEGSQPIMESTKIKLILPFSFNFIFIFALMN